MQGNITVKMVKKKVKKVVVLLLFGKFTQNFRRELGDKWFKKCKSMFLNSLNLNKKSIRSCEMNTLLDKLLVQENKANYVDD